MELCFGATEMGCMEENGAMVCGASNAQSADAYHYIALQGCADPNDKNDEGIHFEVDDQINGDYNLLASCSVSRGQVTLDLHHDVPWHPNLKRIMIDCRLVHDEAFDSFVAGLRHLFRDRPGDLRIENV